MHSYTLFRQAFMINSDGIIFAFKKMQVNLPNLAARFMLLHLFFQCAVKKKKAM